MDPGCLLKNGFSRRKGKRAGTLRSPRSKKQRVGATGYYFERVGKRGVIKTENNKAFWGFLNKNKIP